MKFYRSFINDKYSSSDFMLSSASLTKKSTLMVRKMLLDRSERRFLAKTTDKGSLRLEALREEVSESASRSISLTTKCY
jgi:hypothetical protein